MNIPQPKPTAAPAIVRTASDLRACVTNWRDAGLTVGLVPTMGALHEGHLSLIRAMEKKADRVVVSIFVNPTQFGPNEDFDRYPRDEEDDLQKITATGGDLVYLPDISEIYENGAQSDVSAGPMGDVLCGNSRPGHFDGVATVVAKLLGQCAPDIAIFGEKDYQQLMILRSTTAALDPPVGILGAPIVREADGLALSSRNRYLDAGERASAVALSATMRDLLARASEGGDLRALEAEGTDRIVKAGFERVDYLEFRDGETLMTADGATDKTRLFGAAVIAGVRLIDNMAVSG